MEKDWSELMKLCEKHEVNVDELTNAMYSHLMMLAGPEEEALLADLHELRIQLGFDRHV